jgi:hypothetical protein
MKTKLIRTSELSRFVARIAGVLSSSGKPVSAKHNLFSPRPRGITVLCQLLGFALFLLFLVAPVLRAESLEDAAHDLAMKVCASARKQPVRVHWQETAESPGYLSESGRKVFLEQISACGMALSENSDAPALTVVIRVTATRALLIADVTDAAGGQQIYMVEFPRASLYVARGTSPTPQLRRELLWQQEKPIQSAVEWQDQATEERFLFLLSDGLFIRCRFENGAWRVMDSTELPAVSQWRPRLGEGFFAYSQPKEKLEFVLHNILCDFNANGRVSFSCSETGFGGKVVDLSSSCEASPRYLSTGKGDYTQPDRITLTRPVGEGAAASQEESYAGSVDMPGPVLDISVTEHPKAAFAVVKNLSTGDYEVYRITAVCGN